jgi:hypothetical protein
VSAAQAAFLAAFGVLLVILVATRTGILLALVCGSGSQVMVIFRWPG